MTHYHLGLVALSIGVAMLASYTALDLANSVPLTRGRARIVWLAAGSLAMGFGIWSMHFTGMLAFHLPGHPIAYSIGLLVASVVVAIVASAVALYTITQSATRITLLLAGFAMAAAIAGMHYTGMAGLRTSASVEWNTSLILASITIAIVASFVALALAMRVRGAIGRHAMFLKLGGAAVMGVAIAGMHYTGMAAATFVPFTDVVPFSEGYLIASDGLAIAVVGSTVIILAIAIGGSVITREMGRRAVLANQVRASEEYYRALIEHASDLICVADADGRFMFASSSYERILGYDPDALRDSDLFELVHPDDRARARFIFTELLHAPGSSIRHIDVRVAHSDGTWRNTAGFGQNLLDNPAVRGIVITSQDETDRRRLELQFQQSQKMEAVGKLAGGIAHDFNNLLTVILGNAQILTADQIGGGSQELREISDAAERAASLTKQLLAFSRRQVLQPRVVDLNEIVRGIQQILTRLLGEHIEIAVNLADEVGRVRADPGQVEQAIMNLAVNARDAMPGGGTLSFTTCNVPVNAEIVGSHDPIPIGDYVCLTVRDNGSGIDPATMTRMFEPFFTTKDVGQGTGLGLATVYGIMKQSGGYVSVQSEIGKGAIFNLYFPRVVASNSRLSMDGMTGSALTGRETILVVEDELAVRKLVKRVLEKNGYRVLESPDAGHAFQLAREYFGPIHLLLSDVVLPQLNGREVADNIVMLRPGIRIVFMSGYTEDEVLRRGVFSDGVNFLQKPFEPAKLLQTVRSALA